MDVRELATFKWGHADVRTVAVCAIFEQMGESQAVLLYCYLCNESDLSKCSNVPADDHEEWDDADLEMGFDPYSGCYDFDC